MSKGDQKGKLGHLGRFVALSYALMDTQEYIDLSSSAKVLLLDVARQYNGRNNGRLSPSWHEMKKRGWKSENTLNRAKKELRSSRFITVTRFGVRGPKGKGKPELWAITWFKLDYREDFNINPRDHNYLGYIELKINPNAKEGRQLKKLVKTSVKAAGKLSI